MACGCGRNNSPARRSVPVVPQTNQRTINPVAGLPAQAPRAERSATGLHMEKRKTQALRRDAIRKALGK